MNILITTVADYIAQVPAQRKQAIETLKDTVKNNLPQGFVEGIGYKMIAFSVPHSIYPAGYHCDPKIPLPFINIANQKNFIALYHSGIYADPKLHDWFVNAYAKQVPTKLDMGKSCIRFKKIDQIPYDLIGQLCQKMTVEQWVTLYEKNVKR